MNFRRAARGFLRKALDMGVRIFSYFILIISFLVLVLIIVINMLQLTEPCGIEITMECWSVLIFILGLLTFCEFVLSKLEDLIEDWKSLATNFAGHFSSQIDDKDILGIKYLWFLFRELVRNVINFWKI